MQTFKFNQRGSQGRTGNITLESVKGYKVITALYLSFISWLSDVKYSCSKLIELSYKDSLST